MLNKKVVVVTGGVGLLGCEFCRSIAENGGVAIVADINSDAATRLAEEINLTNPGSAEPARLDITDRDSLDKLIEVLLSKYQKIDAVVNSAYPRNKNWGRKLEAVTYQDFCENTNMHLGGYFLVAQRFAIQFKKQGHGNIINIGSIYGTKVPRFELYEGTQMTVAVEYAAIKSAVIQLTRYFAEYFKHDGVRSNAISPGGIFDNQPEAFLTRYRSHCSLKGMLDRTDINGLLVFLLSDASRYITGQNFIIDDGFTL